MLTNKINEKELNNLCDRLEKNFETFKNYRYDLFKNGYISNCTNERIVYMKNRLNNMYKNVYNTYVIILNWWKNYLLDFENCEKQNVVLIEGLPKLADNNMLNSLNPKQIIQLENSKSIKNSNFESSCYNEETKSYESSSYESALGAEFMTFDFSIQDFNLDFDFDFDFQMDDFSFGNLNFNMGSIFSFNASSLLGMQIGSINTLDDLGISSISLNTLKDIRFDSIDFTSNSSFEISNIDISSVGGNISSFQSISTGFFGKIVGNLNNLGSIVDRITGATVALGGIVGILGLGSILGSNISNMNVSNISNFSTSSMSNVSSFSGISGMSSVSGVTGLAGVSGMGSIGNSLQSNNLSNFNGVKMNSISGVLGIGAISLLGISLNKNSMLNATKAEITCAEEHPNISPKENSYLSLFMPFSNYNIIFNSYNSVYLYLKNESKSIIKKISSSKKFYSLYTPVVLTELLLCVSKKSIKFQSEDFQKLLELGLPQRSFKELSKNHFLIKFMKELYGLEYLLI